MHTAVLTTSIVPAWSSCLPLVMMSNFWFALPSQGFSWTGIRFWRKSPAAGSMERHCPLAALMVVEEKARVAVGSRGLASAAAAALRTPPARAMGAPLVRPVVLVREERAMVVWRFGRGERVGMERLSGERKRRERGMKCFMAGGRGLGVGRECGAIKWIRGEWRKEWKDPSSR